ncbi:MAG: Na+/H+ antiporter NhaC family protein [Thermoplasmatota archaeon]
MEFGILSIVPPVVAIILAIWTKKVIPSLAIGIWSGAIIYSQSLGIATATDWMMETLADTWYLYLAGFMILLGPGIALLYRAGGTLAIANWAAAKLKNERQVGIVTWLLGMLFFVSDYGNSAVVGTTMKDIAAKYRISKEKLSYILDSTAAPVATFTISDWMAYQLGMVAIGLEAAGITDIALPPFQAYLRGIPFNLYCLLAVVMVGIIVISRRDYGEMLDAEHRSWTTGQIIREDGEPLQKIEQHLREPLDTKPLVTTFITPILTLVLVTMIGVYLTGSAPGRGVLDIFENAEWVKSLFWGSLGMIFVGALLNKVLGIMNFDEIMTTFKNGLSVMLNAVTIIILAWTIGTVTDRLGTADYVVALSEGIVGPISLPIIILLAAAFIAFSTGTSWGTMAIITPIALPLAWEITGDLNMVYAMIGVVFSGAIFGDHCSPISDTTVLASTFSGSDHIDHVRTQIYYAVTLLAIVIILLLIYGLTSLPVFVLIPLGILMAIGAVYLLSEWDSKRKGIPAKPTDTDREKVLKEIREAAKEE